MQQLTSASLFQTFTSITEASRQLSAQLDQAAESLQKKGEIPGEHLLAAITTLRQQFFDLRAQSLAVAETLSLPSRPAIEALTSLPEIRTLLEETDKAEEQRTHYEDVRRQAFATLDRVLLIQHQDQESFPPLLECRERAQEMRSALLETTWPDTHPAAEALANGEDPFSDLLFWIEQQNTLDDDHWALLQDTVEQFFSKQLAIAVSRGKLFLADSSERSRTAPFLSPSTMSAAVQTEPTTVTKVASEAETSNSLPEEVLVAAEPPAEPVRSLEEKKSEPEKPRNSKKTPENASTASPAQEEKPSAAPEAVGQPLPEVLAMAPLPEPTPLVAQYSFGPDDPAQHIAATIIQEGDGPHPPTTLRDLTWRLIFEDKLTFAFHLASYLDANHPQLQLSPPGWLLRSIILGRHLRQAKGEAARFLEGDLRNFSPALYLQDQGEWNQSMTLLLAAATLQPALLAPHTQAPAILDSLRWEADLPHLSSYCKSIANYAKSQSPFNPNRLKKGKEQASWQAEIDTLKQAVELWWTRAPRIAFTYAPAGKVWQKWLEAKGVIATLISPIRQNDTSKAAVVKRTIDTFTDDPQLTREIHYTDHEVLGRHLGGDISGRSLEQLRFHAREATGFARRWLELQEIHIGQHADAAFEHMEQLRQTAWTLRGAVQEELSLFKRRHPSLLMVSSITCCRRAIDHLQPLFDPEATFPTEEPLPRPLLYADLLRIPTVSLNEQWEVQESDWESLVNGVLELLANSAAKRAAA